MFEYQRVYAFYCRQAQQALCGSQCFMVNSMIPLISMDWFVWENRPETHGFLPSNWVGFPVKIFPWPKSVIRTLLISTGQYGGWRRNPASPLWMKPERNNGMFTTYQLVIRISLAHPQYHKNWFYRAPGIFRKSLLSLPPILLRGRRGLRFFSSRFLEYLTSRNTCPKFFCAETPDRFILVVIVAGWWFQTWILFSISYMGCHPSHWRTHTFQDGRYTTNQIVTSLKKWSTGELIPQSPTNSGWWIITIYPPIDWRIHKNLKMVYLQQSL